MLSSSQLKLLAQYSLVLKKRTDACSEAGALRRASTDPNSDAYRCLSSKYASSDDVFIKLNKKVSVPVRPAAPRLRRHRMCAQADNLEKRGNNLCDEIEALEQGLVAANVPEGDITRVILKSCFVPDEEECKQAADAALDQRDAAQRERDAAPKAAETPEVARQAAPLDDDTVHEIAPVGELSPGFKPTDRYPLRMVTYHDDDDERNINRDDASDTPSFENNLIAEEFRGILHPHQIDAIQFILENWRSSTGTLVNHTMGLGKTLSFLCACLLWCRVNPRARIVLTAPAIACSPVWVTEACSWEFLKPLKMHTFKTPEDVSVWQQKGGILLMSHERFYKYFEMLNINSDTILGVDEAHLYKATKSVKHKGITRAATGKKVLLTGTSIQNNVDEFFSLIKIVAPEMDLVSFKGVLKAKLEQAERETSTPRQLKELHQLIRVLRQVVGDIMHERGWGGNPRLTHLYPPKAEYRIGHSHPFAERASAEHRVIADAFEEYHATVETGIPEKVGIAVKLIQSDESESWLVMSHRIAPLEAILEAFGGKGLLITGDTPEAARLEIIREFKQEPGKLLCMTLAVGGVALTLTSSNRLILLHPQWNPAAEEQAIGRIWRLGQKRRVHVYRLVAEGTIEERAYAVARLKAEVAKSVLGGEDSSYEAHPEEDEDKGEDTLNELRSALPACRISKHQPMYRAPTELGEADVAEVHNRVFGMQQAFPRRLSPPSGKAVAVQHDQPLFPPPNQTTLVPAYPPYCEMYPPYIYVHNAPGECSFQVAYRKLSTRETEWTSAGPPCRYDDNCKEILLCEPGTYQFRSRLYNERYGYGGWSEPSASLAVGSSASTPPPADETGAAQAPPAKHKRKTATAQATERAAASAKRKAKSSVAEAPPIKRLAAKPSAETSDAAEAPDDEASARTPPAERPAAKLNSYKRKANTSAPEAPAAR